MSFKGDLSTIGLAEVFQMISMGQKEGTLVVRDDESRKAIYFGKEGVQLLSSGKRKGFRIGDILVRAGKITVAQLREVLQKQQETKRLLGEELIATGTVTQKDIDDVVRSQVEEEIYDLFLWKKAQFEFIEGPPVDELRDPDSHIIRLAFDINSLLLEAVRRTDEWTLINQKIPSMDCVYSWAGEAARTEEEASAEDAVKAVAGFVDGQSSVNDIIESSLVPRFEVCKILIDLLDRGRIRLLSVPEMAAVARQRLEEGRREKGFRLFQVATLLAPDDAELLGTYAHAIETEGLIQDAARMYVRVGNILKSQGQKKDSLAYFQRAVSLNPNDAQSKVALFEINLAAGNVEDAVQTANEVVNGALKERDFETARAVAEQAVEAAPQNADIRLMLARVYHAIGEKARRNEVVGHLMKNLPVDPMAAQRIQTELREMTEITRETVKPAITRTGRTRGRRKGKAGVLVVVLLLAGIGGGAFKFDMDAREDYRLRQSEAERAFQEKDWEGALGPYDLWFESLYAYHPLLKGKVAAERQSMKERIDRGKTAVVTPPPVEPETTDAEMESLADRMVRLRDLGEPEEALSAANRLRSLAGKHNRPDLVRRADPVILEMSRYLGEAHKEYEKAIELERSGQYRQSAQQIRKLMNFWFNAKIAKEAQYPLFIEVRPGEARVEKDGVPLSLENGSILLHIGPKENFTLVFRRPGFRDERVPVSDPQIGEVRVELLRKKERWIRSGFRLSAPIQVSGKVVLLPCDRSIFGLDAAEGHVLFKHNAGANIDVAPRLSGGLYYFAAGRRLVGLDPAERNDVRREKFSFEAGERISSAPAFHEDAETVFFACEEQLHAVRLGKERGVLLWKQALPRRVVADPVVHGDLLVAACTDGMVYAFRAGDSPTGNAWKIRVGSSLESAPCLTGSTLLVAGSDSKLVAIDLDRGSVLWEIRAGDGRNSPAVAGHTVLVCRDRTLLAFVAAGGAIRQKWHFNAEREIGASPLVVSPVAVFGSNDDTVYCIDTDRDGQLVWRYDTGGGGRRGGDIRYTPAFGDGVLYFGSDDSSVHAVALSGE